MSVISVAVIGKDGMPIVARQQAKIPAIKINSLFMSFSRLLEKNQKLSYIETPDVRYFYRPLDNDLNLVLVTDLNCNFLQHLELLNLLTKVLLDLCDGQSEEGVRKNACKLLNAIDETVFSGVVVALDNVDKIMIAAEMDSLNDNEQSMVRASKERDAKRIGKDKAKEFREKAKERAKRNMSIK